MNLAYMRIFSDKQSDELTNDFKNKKLKRSVDSRSSID